MSESFGGVIKVVDNADPSRGLVNSEVAAADSEKLTEQLAAGFLSESALRIYSAPEGLGQTLSLLRLDMAIAGRSIAGSQALSGVIAGEAVGRLFDGIKDLSQ